MSTKAALSNAASQSRGASSRAFLVANLAAAFVSTAMAVLIGVTFKVWVRADDAIVWTAEEHSTTPRFPAGHELFGRALEISLFAFAGFACAALLVAAFRSRVRWTLGRVGWAALFAGAVGMMPLTAIWSSAPVAAVFVVPALIAFGCLVGRTRTH